MQRWLARAFIRRTGPREGITRIRTAGSVYYACRWLVLTLAAAGSPVRRSVDLTGAHLRRSSYARRGGDEEGGAGLHDVAAIDACALS